MQFTSGSTASPKGVALTHANLSANIDAFGGPTALRSRATILASAGCRSVTTWGWSVWRSGALYAARPCVLLPPQAFVKRPAEWLRAITRHRGDGQLRAELRLRPLRPPRERSRAGLDLSSWRVAGCGAEPIHAATLSAFSAKFAAAGFRETSFLPCYGLAEHVLAATVSPRGRRPARRAHVRRRADERDASPMPQAEGDRSLALVSCGPSLPGHQLRIVERRRPAVAERHVGEILLAGPSVMRGYYNEPALTAETIRDGWLHTGDLGYLSDGELFVCGRAKDIIIVNGRKYHSAGSRVGGGRASAACGRDGRLRLRPRAAAPIVSSSSSSRTARSRPNALVDGDSARGRRSLRLVSWTMWSWSGAEPSAGRRAARCSVPRRSERYERGELTSDARQTSVRHR